MTHTSPQQPSNQVLRSFGLLVGGVFALLGIYPILRGLPARPALLLVSIGLFLPALAFPRILLHPYRLWMIVGHWLGWMNTRLLLTVIYYLIFTPMGLWMRLRGKTPLELGVFTHSESYRLPRKRLRPEHHKRMY